MQEGRKKQKKCEAANTRTRSWGVLTRHRHKLLSKSDSDTANITFPIASLPEHLIFRILTFLPAHVLHNVVIYFCWSWYRLIKNPIFVRDNLLGSSSFLNFNTYAWCQIPSELHLQISHNNRSRGPKLQITHSALPLCCQVLATCNGLILARNSRNSEFSLHLANPVTGEMISNFPKLPTESSRWFRDLGLAATRVAGISYISSLGTYKVVVFLFDPSRVMVLTLGTNTAWRYVDTSNAKAWGYIQFHIVRMHFPISIDGYIFWTNSFYPTKVLVFEAESEKLFYISSPTKMMISSFLMSNGCWLGVAEFEGLTDVQIWALTDVEHREWTKIFAITMPIHTLFPCFSDGFNKYIHRRKAQLIHCSTSGEVMLVYFSTRSMALYWRDVISGAYRALVHDKPLDDLYFYTRVESLVSPKSISTTTSH